MQNKKAGFTLLELLVVVLVIGILAAVAVPQYQKAVLKARMSEMQTIVRKIYDVKQTYQLANNAEPTSFEELDLDFGSNYSNAITYVKNRFRCELWGSCANAIAIKDIKFYISLRGNPAQWKCCWSGENKKIQKACQSFFPNGEYVPNAPQMGFENEQCVVAPF